MRRSAVVLAAVFGCSVAVAGPTRTYTLHWAELPDAKSYELQVSRNADLSGEVIHKTGPVPAIAVTLEPGIYYYRYRGRDEVETPLAWSAVLQLVLNEAPPVLVAPPSKHVFKQEHITSKLVFDWKPGLPGSRYVLEVRRRNNQIVFKRNVTDTSYTWVPDEAGEYLWRVGFEGGAGEEWGKFRPLRVEENKSIDRIVIKTKLVDDTKGWEWWLIGRFAQSVVTGTVVSNESSLQLSKPVSAITTSASAELRWRSARKIGSPWLLSGSVNFELLSQSIPSGTYYLPRAYARLFLTHGVGKFRWGPLFQAGAAISGVLYATGADSVGNFEKIRRTNFAVGGVGVLQLADTLYLSFLALARFDLGGQAPSATHGLDKSLGIEVGGGAVLNISQTLIVEGRLRLYNEKLQWTVNQGSGSNSNSNTFYILDLGLGFQL